MSLRQRRSSARLALAIDRQAFIDMKEIYFDAELETVATGAYFPKIRRKDFVIALNLQTSGPDPDPVSTCSTDRAGRGHTAGGGRPSARERAESRRQFCSRASVHRSCRALPTGRSEQKVPHPDPWTAARTSTLVCLRSTQ